MVVRRGLRGREVVRGRALGAGVTGRKRRRIRITVIGWMRESLRRRGETSKFCGSVFFKGMNRTLKIQTLDQGLSWGFIVVGPFQTFFIMNLKENYKNNRVHLRKRGHNILGTG